MALTPLALANRDLLQRLNSGGDIESIAALAREVGRDKSNLAKTLNALAEEGLITAGRARRPHSPSPAAPPWPPWIGPMEPPAPTRTMA